MSLSKLLKANCFLNRTLKLYTVILIWNCISCLLVLIWVCAGQYSVGYSLTCFSMVCRMVLRGNKKSYPMATVQVRFFCGLGKQAMNLPKALFAGTAMYLKLLPQNCQLHPSYNNHGYFWSEANMASWFLKMGNCQRWEKQFSLVENLHFLQLQRDIVKQSFTAFLWRRSWA